MVNTTDIQQANATGTFAVQQKTDLTLCIVRGDEIVADNIIDLALATRIVAALAPSSGEPVDAGLIADSIIKAPCGQTTIGNLVCAEISWERLRPALVNALSAALPARPTAPAAREWYVVSVKGGDFDSIPISMFGQPAIFPTVEAANAFCAFAQASGAHEVRERDSALVVASPLTRAEGEGMAVVPRHYAENVGYAAAMLENSASVIDRHNAPALRSLQSALTADQGRG